MMTEDPPISQESVKALADCLMPHPASLQSTEGAFRSWLEQLAEGWVRAGITGPAPRTPDGRESPPDPAGVDGDSVNIARIAPADDIREAAEWAADARFLGAERRTAMTLLADVLAIGAAAPLPAFLSGREAGAILDSLTVPDAPSVTLWRPVDGRETAGIWSAMLWNRFVGDPYELHSGPECVAAAVAVAEAGDRTVGELLDAIVVGCGIGNWHRDAVGATLESAGIHPPGALAPVATAAAVGRLEGVGARDLARGLRRASALTPMHPYRASSEGASARLLFGAFGQVLGAAATLRIKSPVERLPVPSLSRRARRDGLPPFDPRLASRAIHQVPLKKFPASRAVQSVLAAIEKLPRITPDLIESITVETYPWSATISGWSRPDTGPIAMQSHIPTAVALMLQAREQRIPFEAGRYPEVRDRATIALADRVLVRSAEFGEEGAPPSRRIRWSRVTILPKAGPKLTASSGPPFAPPPPGAIRDRFANLTRGATVREPHRFPDTARVRDFLVKAVPAAPEEPAPALLPSIEPGSEETAEDSVVVSPSLFGQS